MERLRQNSYLQNWYTLRFGRMRTNGGVKAEKVDFVEIPDWKVINALECKLSGTAQSHAQKDFLERYPDANFQVISPEDATEILVS